MIAVGSQDALKGALPSNAKPPSGGPSLMIWGTAAVTVAVLYYQFPGARGWMNGFLMVIILGMLLANYPNIRADISKIMKG